MMHPRGRILFVVTSAAHVGPRGRETGYEFSEVARPFLVFAASGFDVDFASVHGGVPPEDGYDEADSASAIFRKSTAFRRLNASATLGDVDFRGYDGVFFPGGLGPMVDLVEEPALKAAISSAYEAGKVLGAVCHGPAALLGVRLGDESLLLEGRSVTSFTEAEEEGDSRDDVPFLLDAAMKAEGALHTHARPFECHVVVDGRLVTGQNPASAIGVAQAMIAVLQERGLGAGTAGP